MFTTADLIQEIERELKQRRRVYARLVSTHRLSQRAADDQIGKMEAVLAILKVLDETERLI